MEKTDSPRNLTDSESPSNQKSVASTLNIAPKNVTLLKNESELDFINLSTQTQNETNNNTERNAVNDKGFYLINEF